MVFLNEIKIQFRETIGGTPSRARGIQSTAKFPTRISEYSSLCFTNEETKVQRDEVTHLRSPSSNMGVGSISRDLFPAQCLSYLLLGICSLRKEDGAFQEQRKCHRQIPHPSTIAHFPWSYLSDLRIIHYFVMSEALLTQMIKKQLSLRSHK